MNNFSEKNVLLIVEVAKRELRCPTSSEDVLKTVLIVAFDLH